MAKKNPKKQDKMFRREAAIHYAGAHKIELPDDPTDQELIDTVEKFLRLKLKGRKEEDKYACVVKEGGCGRYFLDDDKYCWFCGQDSSEDGKSGGFDRVLEADEWVGKKADPKKAADKPEEESEAGEQEPEGEQTTEPEETASDEVSLDECTERILNLSRDNGVNAFDIGFELHRVQVTKAYKQGEHKTFEDYCLDAFGMERATAYSYITINKRFERDEIVGLTLEKLLTLAKIKSDTKRQKLLKAAKPKAEGGKSMGRKELKEKVAEITVSQPKTGKGKSTGRPPLPRYRNFVGDSGRGTWTDKKKRNHAIITDADPKEPVFGKGFGLEVKILKNGVTVEVIEVAE